MRMPSVSIPSSLASLSVVTGMVAWTLPAGMVNCPLVGLKSKPGWLVEPLGSFDTWGTLNHTPTMSLSHGATFPSTRTCVWKTAVWPSWTGFTVSLSLIFGRGCSSARMTPVASRVRPSSGKAALRGWLRLRLTVSLVIWLTWSVRTSTTIFFEVSPGANVSVPSFNTA